MIPYLVALTLSLAAEQIPVDNLGQWKEATYRGIAPNLVTVVDGGLRIAVDASASPLIYGFDKPRQLTGFKISASWEGTLDIPAGQDQGSTGADDFVLKFGIVATGDKTLGWIKRRLAADWILQLYELAPKGSGVSEIRFYSTTQQPRLLGTSRQHPLSDLIHEQRIELLEQPGQFEMSQSFKKPVESLGLWISSDGDDTGSSFRLTIHSITLLTAE